MKLRIERMLIALLFALFAAGVTLIIASADDGTTTSGQFTTDCAVCHADYQTTWQGGAHGNAGSDPIFLEAWETQGKPTACLTCHVSGYDPATATWETAGVTCEACHGPANPDHPKEPMQVNLSPDLCGTCHNDTRFGWQGYKVSTHYQRGMDCATCHDPHSTELKITPSAAEENGDGISALCVNCHKETDAMFASSIHHQQGVSCADCHINNIQVDERAPHTVPDHSFAPNIETCNKCHAEEMHTSTTNDGSNIEAATTDVKTASLSPIPEPVSPIGFAAMAGVIGLAGGMVLAPWLERWYRKLSKDSTEDHHDAEN